VKAFDRHCNLLLEGVREFYSEAPRDEKTGKKTKGAPVMKDRYLPKLFVRGDSVILVVRNPK
jgi:small nuclear ribonucleoprotein D2